MSTNSFRETAAKAREAAEVISVLAGLLDAHADAEDTYRHFREGSRARIVADLLLDEPGVWQPKATLAALAGIHPSGVPRAVARLEAAGIEVEHGGGTHGAVYRVVPRD